MSDERTKLKIVDALNDHIAVLRDLDIPEGIEIDEEHAKQISNEGIVVGIGPDAEGVVKIGDKVIFHRKRYLELNPASGGYAGRSVAIMRKLDLCVRNGSTTKYEFITE